MAVRQYWPKLNSLADKISRYYNKYGAKIPGALRTSIDAGMIVFQTVVAILDIWDYTHTGGDPQGTTGI